MNFRNGIPTIMNLAGASESVAKRLLDAGRVKLYCVDSFDAATISFGLRNVQDTAAGLREMARVVRPGGLYVFVEGSRDGRAALPAGHLHAPAAEDVDVPRTPVICSQLVHLFR